MSTNAISDLLGRMTKDDTLLQEFCANPAKVLQREGIVVPPSEIPATIDQVEFSKRLRAAVTSGSVDLTPFAVDAAAAANKHAEIDYQDEVHIDIPIEQGPTKPR